MKKHWLTQSLKEGIEELNALNKRMEAWKEGVDKCKRCHGHGVLEVPNGPDDFAHSFCDCEHGRSLERDYRYGE